jgi:MFS family permease
MMSKTSNVDQARTKRAALLVATLGACLTPFGGFSVIIVLPSIGKEFAMDAISLSWVVTAYLLTTAIFLVPFGRIADLYGRKRIFTYGTGGEFFLTKDFWNDMRTGIFLKHLIWTRVISNSLL